MADIFRSSRLIYRAVESDTDLSLFIKMHKDPEMFQNSTARIPVPQNTEGARRFMKHVEESYLGVVIALPTATATTADNLLQQSETKDLASSTTPIGVLFLTGSPTHLAHHRNTDLGIDILPEFQGKGYGSEAIRWALDWAFDTAGMHRMTIRTFEYNEGARRLYPRLGFTPEGATREAVWHAGRFWDKFQWGMLDREWRELREKQ